MTTNGTTHANGTATRKLCNIDLARPEGGVGTGAVFTTGQIARLLCVAARTVAKWCNAGDLRSYRLPASPDRRIRRADLRAFLTRYGLRDELARLDGGMSVLLYGLPPACLAPLIGLKPEPTILCARWAVEVGALIERHHPVAVVLGLGAVGTAGAADLVAWLAAVPQSHLAVVAIYPEDRAPEPERWAAALQAPADPRELARLVTAVVRPRLEVGTEKTLRDLKRKCRKAVED